MAVGVEVGGVVGVRAPGAEQNDQVRHAHRAVGVEVAGAGGIGQGAFCEVNDRSGVFAFARPAVVAVGQMRRKARSPIVMV